MDILWLFILDLDFLLKTCVSQVTQPEDGLSVPGPKRWHQVLLFIVDIGPTQARATLEDNDGDINNIIVMLRKKKSIVSKLFKKCSS